MSKPPFIISNRRGAELWPNSIQLPAKTTFSYTGIGRTAEERQAGVDAAREWRAKNDGVIRQFYLRMRSASDLGTGRYFCNTSKLIPGIEATYTRNMDAEMLDVRVSVEARITVTGPDQERVRPYVVFIAVIDESTDYEYNPEMAVIKWKQLRLDYPDIPFFLLQPVGTTAAVKEMLHIPPDFETDKLAFYVPVPRDTGTPSWLTLMKAAAPNIYVKGARVAIDNSGSMTFDTVREALDGFLSEVVSGRKGKVKVTEMPGEDWIEAFINPIFTLVPL